MPRAAQKGALDRSSRPESRPPDRSSAIAFNHIRTTLPALLALTDNCNSLHTNAYDEAITTPTEESVRRALAIQMISSLEFGLLKNENPWQGSHFLEWLTDTVEAAVLEEFEHLAERGGVLGAMEAGHQRSSTMAPTRSSASTPSSTPPAPTTSSKPAP